MTRLERWLAQDITPLRFIIVYSIIALITYCFFTGFDLYIKPHLPNTATQPPIECYECNIDEMRIDQ